MSHPNQVTTAEAREWLDSESPAYLWTCPNHGVRGAPRLCEPEKNPCSEARWKLSWDLDRSLVNLSKSLAAWKAHR